MDFAVNLARRKAKNQSDTAWKRWGELLILNLQHLSKIGIPLVPPLVPHWENEETLVVVMPYGTGNKKECLPELLPLEEHLDDFFSGLAKNGFTLGDIPQIKCWNGIPFVHDFSELTGPF